MHYDNHCEGDLGNCHVLHAEPRVCVGDTTNVFHCSIFIIRAHHMVNLSERVTGSEALLIEINCSFSHPKEEFTSKIFDHGLSAEYSLGHMHGVIIFETLEGTRTDSV